MSPVYNFRCYQEHKREIRVPFAYDEDDLSCPACGGAVHRVREMFVSSIVFRGYGWGSKPVPTGGEPSDA